jgi:hypothetical protein
MARIRYLKPDFFKDEDLAEHPYWIRLLFAGLWNIADKEGRLEDRTKRIKVDVFPYDNVDIEKGLQELSKLKNGSKKPFIQRYEINGDKYIQILTWHKHQKPHHTEKPSINPEPPPLNTKGMEKGMENQHEASAGLTNGELTVKNKKNDVSIAIYEYYAKTIKAGASEDAIKNIHRLLTTGFTKEDLLGRIDAYKLKLLKDKSEEKFYIQANNFFGKSARYKDFAPIKKIEYKPADPNCKVCEGKGHVYIPNTGETRVCDCRRIS